MGEPVSAQLLFGVLAFLPALVILYFVLGAQEGFFRHQAMFVALIGGLVLGLLISIPERFILVDASVLFVVVAFPLIETMAKTMLVGLPRFRDREETILLGGAAGSMMASMLVISYAQWLAGQALSWQLVVKVAGASIGLTGAHFVSGLRLGEGPLRGSVTGAFFPSFFWLLPAHVFLGLLGLVPVERGIAVLPLQGDWFWAVPLALYGAGLFFWKTPTFIEKALPRAERRRLRREGLF